MFIESAVFGLMVAASLVAIKGFGVRFGLVYAVRLLAFIASLSVMIRTSFMWVLPAVVGLTVLIPVLAGLYFSWVGIRSLNGAYGDEQRWLAEYVKEDDAAFKWALRNITEEERKEIMIIADTKEELKALAIDRAEES